MTDVEVTIISISKRILKKKLSLARSIYLIGIEMSDLRIPEKNRLRREALELTSLNESDEIYNNRLRYSDTNSEFNKRAIAKNKDRISRRNVRLEEIELELEAIDAGQRDTHLRQQHLENREDTKTRRDRAQELSNVNVGNIKDVKRAPKKYSKVCTHGYTHPKDIHRSANYFKKACSSLPEYIRRNLACMPNNKGYIWKGVCCFGELPTTDTTTILFEKKANGYMLIHEWTHTHIKLYEKRGNNKKILLSSEKRVKKFSNGFSIMDWAK